VVASPEAKIRLGLVFDMGVWCWREDTSLEGGISESVERHTDRVIAGVVASNDSVSINTEEVAE
jgi:hypothetical protein